MLLATCCIVKHMRLCCFYPHPSQSAAAVTATSVFLSCRHASVLIPVLILPCASMVAKTEFTIYVYLYLSKYFVSSKQSIYHQAHS